jgi:PIN domain nuclease of toxin-antitoxin system
MKPSALLLDSNVVVWLDQKPERLSATAIAQIESATQIYLSAVTAWELSIKQSLGKLTLARSISALIQEHGFTELPVSIRHGEAVRDLPLYHRDPFDRLLVAQAMIEGLILVTGDRQLLRYGIPILLA